VKKTFVIACSMTAIAACSAPPLQFVPANVEVSQHKIDAALISTVVTVAPKGEATGKIDIAGSEADVTSLWKSALDDTLLRTAIFRDASPRHLTLTVKVLKLKKTSVLGFGVDSTARYQLIDRDTGQVVFSKDIENTGHASDYVGVDRVRKAVSRSVQENITSFIQQLEASKI
jgi:hypothetical protein